jgi:hypothetical protein
MMNFTAEEQREVVKGETAGQLGNSRLVVPGGLVQIASGTGSARSLSRVTALA